MEGLEAVFRWLHIFAGVLWIGHLYFFNFVNGQMAAKLDGATKKHVVPELMPRALFWFRWSALSTVVFGVLLAGMNGYLVDGLLLGINGQVAGHAMIGFGMWLGLIMAFNVWFVIWPNQQKALGMVAVEADAKAKAARTAMLFSRTNTMLSIPMLYAMVAAQNLFRLS